MGEFRSGFVTLIGRPNTGKSTLVNALVRRKVAAVTPHPQTTRTHLLGIAPIEDEQGERTGQMVLVDTPGVHRGRGHLSREMLRSVRAGLEGRDVALFLADAQRQRPGQLGREDELTLDMLRGTQTPTFLVVNKVDLLASRNDIFPIVEDLRGRFEFAETVPISALRGYNLDALKRLIAQHLPPGPEYFGPEQVTDQPETFLISEIVRERAMLLTHEEVPHTLAARVESDETQARKVGALRRLQVALYCEREGQKAILVGRGGAMIRRIGTEARHELEGILGTQVYLELCVLVRPEWRQNPRFVADLDYHSRD